MNAKHLIATLSLTLAAGATFAALRHGHVEAPKFAPAAECADVSEAAVPRVVVTARRIQAEAAAAPVARIVVTARRVPTGQTLAAASH